MNFSMDFSRFFDVAEAVNEDLATWPVGQYVDLDFMGASEVSVIMSKRCAHLLRRVFWVWPVFYCSAFIGRR